MRKPILYKREFKLPPFRSRPLWGTPRVGKGGGGGVLVEHVERLDRALGFLSWDDHLLHGVVVSYPTESFFRSLLEERIADHAIVVRATMSSFSSEVVVDANNKYRTVLKFSLTPNPPIHTGGRREDSGRV